MRSQHRSTIVNSQTRLTW